MEKQVQCENGQNHALPLEGGRPEDEILPFNLKAVVFPWSGQGRGGSYSGEELDEVLHGEYVTRTEDSCV